jgi:hypothetical protein
MHSTIVSPRFCLTYAKSAIPASVASEWYWMSNCSSSCFHVRIEFGPSEVYHPKAGPMRDYEKSLTRKGSDTEIIPSCDKYRLTCSMELDPSDPLNLVNSGSQYLGGRGIMS